jgi:hypothetical protein
MPAARQLANAARRYLRSLECVVRNLVTLAVLDIMIPYARCVAKLSGSRAMIVAFAIKPAQQILKFVTAKREKSKLIQI